MSAPRLCPPLPGKPFNLQTDASEVGVGAVLFQRGESGDRKIIAYASKKLNPAQGRYSAVERECLAIVWAVDRFRPYLESGKFMLFTDNAALRWLQQARCTNSKLTRWALQLGAFDFEIRHVPGVENEAADALSRCPAGPDTVDEGALENNIHDPPVIRPGVSGGTSGVFGDLSGVSGGSGVGVTQCGAIQPKKDDGNVTLQDVREWQQNDPNIREIVAKLSGDGARFGRLRKLYVIRDNVLHRHPRSIAHGEEGVVVPVDKAPIMLQRFHDHEVANHPGWKETYRSIKSRFFLAGMREAVRNYVRACHVCARVKPLNRKPEDQMCTRVPRQPWEVLSIDLMGPYPRTQRGKTSILVVTDCYSRWVEAYPLGKATTKSIVDTFERELFPRFGYPRALLSDNGPQFVSKAMGDALKRCPRRSNSCPSSSGGLRPWRCLPRPRTPTRSSPVARARLADSGGSMSRSLSQRPRRPHRRPRDRDRKPVRPSPAARAAGGD